MEYASGVEDLSVVVKTQQGGRCRMASDAPETLRSERPLFNGLDRAVGSRGGSELTIKGANFAPDSPVELISDDNQVICTSLTYIDFNTLSCRA